MQARNTEVVGRVIIAEDDEQMRSVLVELLSAEGHEVCAVSDGAELLLELARNNRFHFNAVDVVVADVRMPHCSGMRALEVIRRIPLDLPFILLSAFADSEVHAKASALGAVLLDKPVRMDRLVRIVGEHIAQRTSPRRSSIR